MANISARGHICFAVEILEAIDNYSPWIPEKKWREEGGHLRKRKCGKTEDISDPTTFNLPEPVPIK